ncbi:pyruvate kinase [Ancylobacter defluvii]|uniref:Pyruvate kinase n=1 Tax=Ancylobacter defluvii TaxID=1282440 RepID=A0A9W6K368_9HYPH|nr:pyruvate kinase [Ancylobacter defluvii]MBS7588810.1 pyruvate kinase [Ancylobacter defluvii]GLK86900.1 pyruvate kinase [Ancylobacter defluvii]
MYSRRERATKIVATLGPASSSAEKIKALYEAGVDVFRLNFSHGTQADHGRVLGIVRDLEREVKRPIGVLADLQGPKLRVGRFQDNAITLVAGTSIRFDTDPTPGDDKRVPIPHPEIIEALHVGSTVLLDDGKVRVKVVHKGAGFIEAEVIAGSRLSNNKGFNVPDVLLPVSPLTEKDRADLFFALDLGVEWIALSFVQRPEDVIEARELIQDRARINLKLEKPAAIEHLTRLTELSDSIMVARGDLGVELSLPEIPALQKSIIRESRRFGRPVIVATQMLESMINAPVPTRAEVSDVATAVYDGADAVMLSAESAAGQYPVEAVAMMDQIIKHVERDPGYRKIIDSQRPEEGTSVADAVTQAAYNAANAVDAAAIVTYTLSGTTTLHAARERPRIPVLGIASKLSTARQLVLSYGVHVVHAPEEIHTFAEMATKATQIAIDYGFAGEGDRIAITAGVPFATPGTTNVLRLVTIDKGMVDRKPGSPQPAPRPRAKGLETGGAAGAASAATRKSAELKPGPRKPAAGRPAAR